MRDGVKEGWRAAEVPERSQTEPTDVGFTSTMENNQKTSAGAENSLLAVAKRILEGEFLILDMKIHP